MENETLKDLDLSGNCLSSRNYLLASKMGRLISGHPQFLHVNLSNCGMKREETIYIAWSIRDSPNLLSLHLTENFLPHQDRILIRALLVARLRWPTTPPPVLQSKNISSGDRSVLVMLNICML
jgi:hypothetical protein